MLLQYIPNHALFIQLKSTNREKQKYSSTSAHTDTYTPSSKASYRCCVLLKAHSDPPLLKLACDDTHSLALALDALGNISGPYSMLTLLGNGRIWDARWVRHRVVENIYTVREGMKEYIYI